MRPIAYRFRAATSPGLAKPPSRPRTGASARPILSRQANGRRPPQFPIPAILLCTILLLLVSSFTATTALAATRPHYGGTLRVMMQSTPDALNLPPNATAAEYWDLSRALSLIGDTLVTLDVGSHPHPALAIAWQTDATARHWDFTLRPGVRFHDGSEASPSATAVILGTLHPTWTIRASPNSVSIESEAAMPSLLAELALPQNLLLKRAKGSDGLPIGTGAFLVSEWQPGKVLKLVANEQSWSGRPFIDAIEIQFGKSPGDQALALELEKTDVIEASPQAATGSRRIGASSSSLPVELLALVFSANSKAQDRRLREALALAIDRKPIQSVLLKGAGEAAASVLPNWMTGYTAVFPAQTDPQRARVLLADSRQPALNLTYDPRDPQAQLIAERIALNAKEAGIIVQVSLSGAADIRLTRIVLPSPDAATSLSEAARQLGLGRPALSLSLIRSLDDLYQAEHSLLDGAVVIPLFHLPVASASGTRLMNWRSGRLGGWGESSDPGYSLADAWLKGSLLEAGVR
jgi:peptide/nickel transport system substrate-binding protein